MLSVSFLPFRDDFVREPSSALPRRGVQAAACFVRGDEVHHTKEPTQREPMAAG